MSANAALAITAIRATLASLDDELAHPHIALVDTERRLASLITAAREALTSRDGVLSVTVARHLKCAASALRDGDPLTARAQILAALK